MRFSQDGKHVFHPQGWLQTFLGISAIDFWGTGQLGPVKDVPVSYGVQFDPLLGPCGKSYRTVSQKRLASFDTADGIPTGNSSQVRNQCIHNPDDGPSRMFQHPPKEEGKSACPTFLAWANGRVRSVRLIRTSVGGESKFRLCQPWDALMHFRMNFIFYF